MTVIILSACPAGLRGQLTRWLLEVSAGVYVGHISARVRAHLWARVSDLMGNGRALLIYTRQGEQRLHFETYGHDWTPTDFEGVTLMMRPNPGAVQGEGGAGAGRGGAGWSSAARLRKYGRRR